MPFDKTQPADSTKIRNLGVVIRPNWAAIEEGDTSFKPYSINLADRSILPIPVNPAAVANAYQMFCKKDSGGNPQIYVESPGGSVVKLTTSVIPVSAQNGYSWLSGGIIIQWGLGHANATANTTIAFPIAFSAVPYSITTNFYRSSGSTTMKPLDIISGTPPTVNNFTVWNANGGHDFFWQAIGPKV